MIADAGPLWVMDGFIRLSDPRRLTPEEWAAIQADARLDDEAGYEW